ncbi:putative serine protease F56F10.1 isoform X1 [Diorhabda carinulata]|uniref:putative serine protease F56F10.1 isoform X1 n=2 Tax=Diorhabda carinulata TaxID=1163345 RepID=UPI0025A154F7|nr:putative serine protease F56F10.1 isoform X1 [Diorhabda carinulata]
MNFGYDYVVTKTVTKMNNQILSVLIIFVWLSIFNPSTYGYKYFRNGRLGSKKEPTPPSKYEKWFTQNLDHFNPNDERNWQQRYFVNDEYANDKRDVAFLMIGGEGTASDYWMTNGSWISYAQKYRPVLFQLEHRYYGKSYPTENLSTENLLYLTSQQALGDLAFFMQAMNSQYELSPDVKWIVFGGSYPGCLAAWLRQKYPHLTHGAMSASGPLLAKLDFSEYFKVVADALRASNENCASAVKQGTAQIEILLQKSLGRKNLDDIFRLCESIEDNIDNNLDISNFFQNLADNFAGIVQYNKDNRESTRKLNITVDTLCDIMVNETIGPEVNRLAAVNDLLLRVNNETCLDYKYDKMIEELKNISWDSEASEGGRQWTYQTCTEFGYYQTSSYKPHIFGNRFDITFSIQQCEDIFGSSYNRSFLEQAVYRTNTLYGGLDLEVSNVVFVHGSLDPWHVLGITETTTNEAPAILIKGAAHCANMYNPADDDTPQLKAARVQIEELIGKWIDL